MSGQWPPEWDDPDDDVAADAGQADAAADARLSEVTAYLAALPDPALPEPVEARISAAITALAAERAEAPPAGSSAGHTLGPAPKRARVRRSRRFRVRAVSSVAACLVLAGFGFLLTRLGGSSTSSSAESAAGAATAAASASASASRQVNGQSFSGSVPAAAVPAPAASAAPSAPPFRVTARGDVYQAAALASQVRERLGAAAASVPNLGMSGESSAPGQALVGCVLRVTDEAIPRLVDKAVYQGEAVYVIAVSDRAWVVGRGCTSTDTELITTVSLAGLRGNLRALGSVER